jgi:hypothetical protein
MAARQMRRYEIKIRLFATGLREGLRLAPGTVLI